MTAQQEIAPEANKAFHSRLLMSLNTESDHDPDEAFYILEGTLTVTCGDQTFTATPGSFVYQPRGIVHWFKVEGDQPAKLLQINTPTGLEHFFEEMGEPAKQLTFPPAEPPNVEKMQALAAKYHLEIKGPPPRES